MIDILIATRAVDIVGIYDVDFNQLFPLARPIKATVTEDATFFKHPLESSATRTDHIIFMPVKVAMSLVISDSNYKTVYQQIKQAFRSQVQLVIQTKTDTYENIYIQGMPYEETPGNFDSVIMSIVFEETKFAITEIIFQPESESDGNTKNRGQQEAATPTDAQEQKGSTFARWFK